ncbi:hypothetical protein B0920_19750 [Massilia sp. KIM]|uniref:hypothetical protein n=1 Tax=Massilia sp. KIM TaxID=1955422 RepID=UPI00098F3CD6|nr:hypothetical protein [Massilia sp. KIM]OON61156.1 hypothetical protein B0920_19750 [Massilia sp. KIM]
MKQLAAMLSTLLLAGAASACPLTEALSKRYGISALGFTTAIPAAEEPVPADGRHFVRIRLKPAPWISDAFQHTVLADPVSRKAWILRTGGLAGVREWYGPVEVDNPSLENCRADADAAPAPREA